jgi:hypothetical protein
MVPVTPTDHRARKESKHKGAGARFDHNHESLLSLRVPQEAESHSSKDLHAHRGDGSACAMPYEPYMSESRSEVLAHGSLSYLILSLKIRDPVLS